MRCKILKIFEIIKILSCISLVLVLNACITGLRPDSSDKYSFNNRMIEILGSDVKIIVAINKSQAQISSVERFCCTKA